MKYFIFLLIFSFSIFSQDESEKNSKNEIKKNKSRISNAINKNDNTIESKDEAESLSIENKDEIEDKIESEERIKFEKDFIAEKSRDNSSQSSSFYGIEIKGEKIVFLLDYSGSMLQEVKDKEITSSSETKKNNKAINTRFDVLKKELTSMLETLSAEENPAREKSKFLLVFFSPLKTFPESAYNRQNNNKMFFTKKITPEKARLKFGKFGSKSTISRANKFIDRLDAGGGTNLLEAITATIHFIKKEKVDTIFILTDGDYKDQKNIRALLREIKSQTKVNCISIGSDSASLKELADDNKDSNNVQNYKFVK